MEAVELFDQYMEKFGEILSKPEDQARMLLLMFLAYPLGYCIRMMPGAYMRHAYSIIIGTIIHYLMFREGTIHFWAMSIITYALIAILPRNVSAKAVFVFNISYLSVCHINRVLYDYGSWSLDATTYIMPLVSKLSTLGYLVNDGATDEKKLDDYQRQKRLTKIPQLYEVISYMTFPGGNLCGPFFEFKDYKDFIEGQGVFANIPSTIMATGYNMVMSVIVIVLCVIVPTNFDLQNFADPKFYDQYPFWYTCIYYWIACIGVRLTFYVGFTLIQGSIIFCGLGYNGWHKQSARFDRVVCVDVIGVETCCSPRDGFAYWNASTATWLRYYVYNRFLKEDKSNSTAATMVTNLLSAFWHGFYPFYYNTFFFSAFIVEIAKDIFRNRHLFSFMPSFLSSLILYVLSLGALNYLATGMILLDLNKAMVFYRNTYFFGHILIVGTFILMRFVVSPMTKKGRDKLKNKKD